MGDEGMRPWKPQRSQDSLFLVPAELTQGQLTSGSQQALHPNYMAAEDLEPIYWSCEKSEPSSDLLNHVWHSWFSKPSDHWGSSLQQGKKLRAHQDLTGVWRGSGHYMHRERLLLLGTCGMKRGCSGAEVRVPCPASTSTAVDSFIS